MDLNMWPLDWESSDLTTKALSVKCMAVTRIRKNFEKLFIPIQAIQGDTHSKRFYTMYTYSNCMINQIITLLTNDLASIYSEINKIRLILWMVYTYSVKANVKEQEAVEKLGRNECTLHRWPDHPRWVIVEVRTNNFKPN